MLKGHRAKPELCYSGSKWHRTTPELGYSGIKWHRTTPRLLYNRLKWHIEQQEDGGIVGKSGIE